MIYYSAGSMRALHHTIEYAPKRWIKNDLTETERNILEHRERIRCWLVKKKATFSLRKRLEKELPGLLTREISPLTPPTLKAPSFFKRELPADIKTFILSLLLDHPEYSRAEKIIQRAELNLQTPEFYTLPIEPEFLIRGNPEATYGNLLCFAHELGHALYELDFAGDEVGSEVAAFLFEDQVAAMLLRQPEDTAEWIEYKMAQDQLNYFLCLNEFHEFDTGTSSMPKNYLFFRESLVTCWGYQTINAWASWQRALASPPPIMHEISA